MSQEYKYLDSITLDMTDDDVQEVVRKAFGPLWNDFNDVQVWTHYETALTRRDDLSLDSQLFSLCKRQDATPHPTNADSIVSSLHTTPSLDPSASPSKSTTPGPDELLDLSPAFYEILEFSTFVLAQAQYIYNHKFQNSPAPLKPRIPGSLTYNQVVDAKYISEIAAEAMGNPGGCNGHHGYLDLMFSVRVPWEADAYIREIGAKNKGQNKDVEKDLKNRFPPGPEFSGAPGKGKVFDTPLTITDRDGKILFWFLPDLISKNAQVPWNMLPYGLLDKYPYRLSGTNPWVS